MDTLVISQPMFKVADFVHACSIAEMKEKGAKVIDVDGLYLYKKRQRLIESGTAVPPTDHRAPPLSGWETVSSDNHKEYAKEGSTTCMCC